MAGRMHCSPADLLAIAEYDRAVFDRFVRRARRLPKKGATRRRGIGHESLFDTLVHILNVKEVWLVYIVRGRSSEKELGALFEQTGRHPTDWKGFDDYSKRVWAGVGETMKGLTPRDLERRVKVFWMPGRYTVRDACLQTTIEEAHHLGEIIGALWQEDRRPPEMTWIDVRRALPSPRKPRTR
ncbi:MAG: DinB family protein [Thermoplasmata archaeon]|nr:DinB family protein [Thermoplasmata archaeon]